MREGPLFLIIGFVIVIGLLSSSFMPDWLDFSAPLPIAHIFVVLPGVLIYRPPIVLFFFEITIQ